ncbi:hypothetical protein DL770_008391 [Monosporascus sp. CRB-9-2]|nr:hypothetical protein DL770_008391 [Monosporascus sp. CRB-9-2]
MDQKTRLNELKVAEGATFDSHAEKHNPTCYPGTRVDLLREISKWVQNPQAQAIFWLNGMAGTGKLTILRTVAHSFFKGGQLGASFFFKRGESDRGGTSKFFTTIAAQLIEKVPALAPYVKNAIDADPAIFGKAIREQFEKLILEPLSKPSQAIWKADALVIIPRESSKLSNFLDDATRLILAKISRISYAPLQVYSSILTFAPARSITRKMFGSEIPSWISLMPEADTNGDKCLQRLEGHGNLVNSVAFSYNSALVASASSDETVRVWRVDTGECTQELNDHDDWVSSVAFSHDSALLASGSGDGLVRVWVGNTGECTHELKGQGDSVSSVAFSHDSKLVVSASDDGTVRVWNIVTDIFPTASPSRDVDILTEISDISDVSTVFTHATHSTGYSSISAIGNDPFQAAAKTLADHLYRDPVLQSLYSQAIREFGTIRFSVNHDKLLKIFMKDLRGTATDPMLLQAEDRTYTLNLLLSQQPSGGEVRENHDRHIPIDGGDISKQAVEESDDSDDDDEEEEFEGDNQNPQPGTFRQLATVVEFVTTDGYSEEDLTLSPKAVMLGSENSTILAIRERKFQIFCLKMRAIPLGFFSLLIRIPALALKFVHDSTYQAPIVTEVQGLCGLAGVTPSTRNLEDWDGSVKFEEDNSVALVSYAHPDIHKVVARVTNALQRFCTALGQAQSAGFCCESFTVLRQPASFVGEQHWDDSVIEETEPLAVLHMCSLSTQIMSMGFQSYIQAHVGFFHPFFLDTPIKKIQLLGCQVIPERYPSIEVSLQELTCVGDMLQGPVLVFSRLQSQQGASQSSDNVAPTKFDLLTSSEDLIDTWGPGQFIIPAGRSKLPSAVRICDGVVFASDQGGKKFHWSRDTAPEKLYQGELNPVGKIRIGSPVTVNGCCGLDEGQCRSRCSGFLRPLGSHPPDWTLAEKQIGVQAGMHTLLQANAAYHHYPGRTLKQFRLDQRDEELVPFLEDHWSVQVSLCTGIARRVPLREMVADLLPIFANGLTFRDDYASWENLKTDHGIFEAFQRKDLKNWLRKLDKPLYDLTLQIIRRILHSLRETGLDRKGKSFLISWPYKDDFYHCFEIDLKQRESSWVRLIADSEDCATFAYVSPKCLETTEIRCRGAGSSWRNAIPLLETAVLVCSPYNSVQTQITVASTLRHQETYYFKKFDSLLFVKAVKPDAAAVARLVEKSSDIPDRFKHRLFARVRPRARLREQRGGQEVGEIIAVLISGPDC